MKQGFRKYVLVWAILLGLFNAVCFVAASQFEALGGSFWVGYIFITLAFVGQLFCAAAAFKSKNAQKLFYNLPLITISYTGLIVMLVFGGLCMAIPVLPNWAGGLLCMLILAFDAIALVKASAAAEIVSAADERIKSQTDFIKTSTLDAQNLLDSAESAEVKAACKKVYEALRYSDPMSDPALSRDEAQIALKLSLFSELVRTDDAQKADAAAQELVALIRARNAKCKALK